MKKHEDCYSSKHTSGQFGYRGSQKLNPHPPVKTVTIHFYFISSQSDPNHAPFFSYHGQFWILCLPLVGMKKIKIIKQ